MTDADIYDLWKAALVPENATGGLYRIEYANKSYSVVIVFFDSETNVWWVIGLNVGSRGRLCEFRLVFDISKQYDNDKLLFRFDITHNQKPYGLIDLAPIKKSLGAISKEEVDAHVHFLRPYLQVARQRLLSDPNRLNTVSTLAELYSESVASVSGGLPGMSKRH